LWNAFVALLQKSIQQGTSTKPSPANFIKSWASDSNTPTEDRIKFARNIISYCSADADSVSSI
jgi:hypothetical protein